MCAHLQENDDPVLPAHIEEEYEDNDAPDMKFQLDPITSQMCVRAATIDKLVERLSMDRDPGACLLRVHAHRDTPDAYAVRL